MVALADIEDIEAALGRTAEDAAEESRWQHYINTISAFISGYCDDSFEYLENDSVRYRADSYGVIVLGGGPVSEVVEITSWRTGATIDAPYDGFEIYGLQPFATVWVTYNHGYTEVPVDIRGLTTDSVVGAALLGATGPVKTLTVGDITEVYGSNRGIGITLQETVLDRYRITEKSLRLGGSMSTLDERTLPTL